MIDSRDTDSRELDLDQRLRNTHGAVQLSVSEEVLASTVKMSRDESLDKVEEFREVMREKGLSRYSVVEVRSQDQLEQEKLMEIPQEQREAMANFEEFRGDKVIAVAPVDDPRGDATAYIALIQGENVAYVKTFGADDYPPVN